MTTPRTNPAITALIDQADAAAAEAHGIVQAAAEHIPDSRFGKPGPIARAVVDRLRDRGLRGKLTLCSHLDYRTPAVAHWTAHAPGRLRCAPCTDATWQRIKGTPEDYTCDQCRHRARNRKVFPMVVQIPPVVLVDFGLTMPAVLAHFALCPGCYRADSATGPDEGDGS